MNRWSSIVGWLLGVDQVTRIDQLQLSLAAGWAAAGSGPFWVFLGVFACGAGSLYFYLRFQHRGSTAARLALGVTRGTLLVWLFLTLAEPVLTVRLTRQQAPQVYVVFDGTESMAIQDVLPDDRRREVLQAVGNPQSTDALTRMDLVQALLRQADSRLREGLWQRTDCELTPFVFDGAHTSRLRRLTMDGERFDPAAIAEQLAPRGQVTALGNVFRELGQQGSTSNLAAVVIFSDFNHNAGGAPIAADPRESLAAQLDVPVFTVGIGAEHAADLGVDLQIEPKIRLNVPTVIRGRIRQTGLAGQPVTVRVTAQSESDDANPTVVGERTLAPTAAETMLEFPFVPTRAGQFRFEIDAEVAAGEVVSDNNRASREANIIDDYVRLMYVAHEPTWEWRFIKEVFHRDKTVGLDGFRTYLASSDPRVRETNPLFLPSLAPKRSDFFANDVLFLDDLPRSVLTERFSEMVHEFVFTLGGGLVVLAGPRFGPSQLEGTPLAEMLPVVLAPDLQLKDDTEFELQRTLQAANYDFMQLAGDDAENERAWAALGPLPWYQPVAQVRDLADVLAVHPRDTCRDGRTPQPLIAIRRYGEGEVVYLGFNETWRLRRGHGETYYRRFWSPLIDRLGLSHALGSRKRFVISLDQQEYRVEETAAVTVQAYDQNYEPLSAESHDITALEAELVAPQSGQPGQSRAIDIPMLRDGLFELRLPLYSSGTYVLRIKDPIGGEWRQREFDVAGLAAERRSAVRDVALQHELARQTGGLSYDLTTVGELAGDLPLSPRVVVSRRSHPLWSTPLWFALVVGTMLLEWFCRKWIRLS